MLTRGSPRIDVAQRNCEGTPFNRQQSCVTGGSRQPAGGQQGRMKKVEPCHTK